MNNIGDLIKKIAPLYNKYKQNKNTLTGTEALEIMWDIGNEIKIYIDSNEIAPHKLFREIYGKSEGTKNIIKKSYITREFQGRCYRIRNIFKNRNDIKTKLPNLKKFILFREAMPFFDNPKFKFNDIELSNLIALLNSSLTPKKIMTEIKLLQKERIGISNPRTQRLGELSNEKEIFINFYNYLYDLLQANDYSSIIKEMNIIDVNYIKLIAQNTVAFSEEGIKYYPFNIANNLPSPFEKYCRMLLKFSEQKDAKQRRRFRRLVSSERILKLSDMLYSITSLEKFKQYKRNK